jgi:hypothetical protein
MDHPKNPDHPSVFHVRNDGWMGACLTFNGPRVIEPKNPLRLRYALYIHSSMPTPKQLDARWTLFSDLPLDADKDPKSPKK